MADAQPQLLGFQGTVKEYRWPVVETDQPPGARVPLGSVVIVERYSPDNTFVQRHIVFVNPQGQALTQFDVETYWVFVSAAKLALAEVGLVHPNPLEAGEIVSVPPAAKPVIYTPDSGTQPSPAER